MASLLAVDFEITGKVQKHAKSLGLRGWVANTERGSVVGQLEGPEEPVEAMKVWLREVGSPKSVITGAAFTNQRVVESYSFENFQVRR